MLLDYSQNTLQIISSPVPTMLMEPHLVPPNFTAINMNTKVIYHYYS